VIYLGFSSSYHTFKTILFCRVNKALLSTFIEELSFYMMEMRKKMEVMSHVNLVCVRRSSLMLVISVERFEICPVSCYVTNCSMVSSEFLCFECCFTLRKVNRVLYSLKTNHHHQDLHCHPKNHGKQEKIIVNVKIHDSLKTILAVDICIY